MRWGPHRRRIPTHQSEVTHPSTTLVQARLLLSSSQMDLIVFSMFLKTVLKNSFQKKNQTCPMPSALSPPCSLNAILCYLNFEFSVFTVYSEQIKTWNLCFLVLLVFTKQKTVFKKTMNKQAHREHTTGL